MAYKWRGMKNITWAEVLERFINDELIGCFLLYDDGTEAMIEEGYNWNDIEKHYYNGGEFGVEGIGFMTFREAARGVVVGDTGMQTYRIGFNDGDETELDARNLTELEELWESLCPEFGCEPNSIDYVVRL